MKNVRTIVFLALSVMLLNAVAFGGTPYNSTPQVLPGRLLAEWFDQGGEGIAYHDADSRNANTFRVGEGVDLAEITPESSDYYLGWAAPGEWINYTVDIEKSGTYELSISLASGAEGGSFCLELDGHRITNSINAAVTGGWTNFQDQTVQGIDLQAGQHTLKIVMLSGGFNLNHIDFVCTSHCSSNQIPQLTSLTTDMSVYAFDQPVTIVASATDNDGQIVEIEFLVDDISLEVLTEAPFEAVWTAAGQGLHKITAIATDNDNNSTQASIFINVTPTGTEILTVEMLAEDFSFTAPVYKDQQDGKHILAVAPSQNPVTGTATALFSGDSARYDLTFHAVGENDGASSYKILVNQTLIAQFTVPVSTESFEFGTAYNLTVRGVILDTDDELKVQATTASADGVEWSRARWYKIVFVPTPCDRGPFVESGGFVIIEMEHTALPSAWGAYPGRLSLGDGYIQYNGNNSLGSPNLSTVITYQVEITNPGTYRFAWRSQNGYTAAKFDQENDSWLQIFADDFYGVENGNTHDALGEYVKFYINSLGAWKFFGQGEHGGIINQAIYATFDEPGVYDIKVAGRSKGHVIDRMALFIPTQEAAAKDLSKSESLRNCSGLAPAGPAVALTVDKTTYTEGENIVATAYAASQNGGSISAVTFYVDDVAKGTVNAAPWQKTLSGVSKGYHTIKAVATDNLAQTSYSHLQVYLNAAPVIINKLQEQNDSEIAIFPNPAHSAFHITPQTGIHSLRVTDVAGRAVFSAGNTGSSEMRIDCSTWQNGIYLLTITRSNGSISCHKILKQ